MACVDDLRTRASVVGRLPPGVRADGAYGADGGDGGDGADGGDRGSLATGPPRWQWRSVGGEHRWGWLQDRAWPSLPMSLLRRPLVAMWCTSSMHGTIPCGSGRDAPSDGTTRAAPIPYSGAGSKRCTSPGGARRPHLQLISCENNMPGGQGYRARTRSVSFPGRQRRSPEFCDGIPTHSLFALPRVPGTFSSAALGRRGISPWLST